LGNSRSRIVIVEDDTSLNQAMAASLRDDGYEVIGITDGEALLPVANYFRPDLAILDVMLPVGADGFELAATLRSAREIPVLFVTALDGLDDRLKGFEAGADDYIIKPFALAEFLARVRAVLRRSGRLASPVWQVRDLLVDEADRTAFRDGAALDLTSTEFDLLCALGRRVGQEMSKARLLSVVWGFTGYDHNLVEVHISALRKKMEAAGPRLIFTVRGGYVMRV
jgi:two-component system, OmpR family, response regulator